MDPLGRIKYRPPAVLAAGQRLKETRLDGFSSETQGLFPADFNAYQTAQKYKEILSDPKKFEKFKKNQRSNIARSVRSIDLKTHTIQPKTQRSDSISVVSLISEKSIDIDIGCFRLASIEELRQIKGGLASSKNPDVDIIGNYVHITLYAIPEYTGNSDRTGLLTREYQALANVTGDFQTQFDRKDDKKHLHGMDGEDMDISQAILLDKVADQIGTVVDRSKPHTTGQATWSIPTEIINFEGKSLKKFKIIQQYEFEKGTLIIRKGHTELLRQQLDIPSDE